MAKIVQYTCDFPGCTQVRTPTNHWFQIISPSNFRKSFIIEAFDPNSIHHHEPDRDFATIFCMCSEAHVIQFISAHLAELQVEPPCMGE